MLNCYGVAKRNEGQAKIKTNRIEWTVYNIIINGNCKKDKKLLQTYFYRVFPENETDHRTIFRWHLERCFVYFCVVIGRTLATFKIGKFSVLVHKVSTPEILTEGFIIAYF